MDKRWYTDPKRPDVIQIVNIAMIVFKTVMTVQEV